MGTSVLGAPAAPWDLKWHSQLCQGRMAAQVLLRLPRVLLATSSREGREREFTILHLLAFIFWLLVVAILSLNLF